jgi:ElaB/YqjD/DUF883 family membrane-anchored ribosome-binding protein
MDTPATPSSRPLERLAEDLRNVVDDAGQLLQQAAGSGDAQYEALKDRFDQQLRRLRLQLDDLEHTAVHKAREAARVADSAVHTHPYAAIGVAAAVGLLLGVVLARR